MRHSLLVTEPSVPVVSTEKLWVSLASTSEKSDAMVIDGPSSFAPPFTSSATGASFWPVMVIVMVAVSAPPLPSSTV